MNISFRTVLCYEYWSVLLLLWVNSSHRLYIQEKLKSTLEFKTCKDLLVPPCSDNHKICCLQLALKYEVTKVPNIHNLVNLINTMYTVDVQYYLLKPYWIAFVKLRCVRTYIRRALSSNSQYSRLTWLSLTVSLMTSMCCGRTCLLAKFSVEFRICKNTRIHRAPFS